MERITDDDLLNYLDNSLNQSTKQLIDKLIQEDEVVAARMKELQTIHLFLLSKSDMEQPNKNFTEKVMTTLHEKPTPVVFSPRNGLFLLIGILIASGLTLTLLMEGKFDQLHTLLNLQSIPLKTYFVKIPTTLPFDLKLVLKSFLLINLIIGFILLDRTILRPIFHKRLERYS